MIGRDVIGRRRAHGSEVLLLVRARRAEPGFMLDNGGARHGRWVRGPLGTGIMGNATVVGRDRVAVRAFRRVQCSRLELFAPADPNS